MNPENSNQNFKQIHVAVTKRGKTCDSESLLVLLLLLIGWESVMSFLKQIQSVAVQNQCKRELLFDTQVKIALQHDHICWYVQLHLLAPCHRTKLNISFHPFPPYCIVLHSTPRERRLHPYRHFIGKVLNVAAH